jgi:hypothetical protein
MPSPEPRYFVDHTGVYIGAFAGAAPPAGAIQVPTAPADARQTWSGGRWSDLPGPTVRQQRRHEYIARLGKEPSSDPIDVIGDVLDVVIAELAARGPAVTREFDVLLTEIAAIKSRLPK